MKKSSPFVLIVVALGVALLAGSWPALKFAEIKVSDLPSRFAAVLFFALLIERAVEVLLTIWRAEEANKRQAAVQRLLSAGKPSTDADVKAAQDALLEYRSETLLWALPLSFFFGLVLAGLGVRLVNQFVVFETQSAAQIRSFSGADIILTAALLAGGADPIHKVMDTFRKFMEASSAKASGTGT